MVAVGVLNAAKEGELVIGPHVQFERLYPGPLAVINSLAVLPICFSARLPITLEHRESETARQRECGDQTPLPSTMLHLCDLRAAKCKDAAAYCSGLALQLPS